MHSDKQCGIKENKVGALGWYLTLHRLIANRQAAETRQC